MKEVKIKPINDDNYYRLVQWRNAHYDKFKQKRKFSLAEHRDWYEDVYKNKNKLGKEIMFVVKVGDDYVGSYGFTNIKDYEVELCRVVTNPEYEGRGHMREAMEKAIAGVSVTGVRRIYLDVLQDNERAVDFYDKLGFKEYKRDKESVYMELWLNRKRQS
jgi:RimJ/RimL family protein N-acetyltransferase